MNRWTSRRGWLIGDQGQAPLYILRGIVGAAMHALESDEMEFGFGSLVTIVAEYVHSLILVLEGHRHALRLVVQVLPQRRHVDQRGLAGGTGVVAGGQQLVEAHLVQQVAAVGNMAGNARGVDVAQTNRAVGSRDVLHAPVAIDLQLDRQTHIADLAVKEVFGSSNPTDSTSMTMVLLLIRIVEEVADQTGILPKSHSAILALFPNRLPRIALGTYQFG